MVTATPQPIYTRERELVPTVKEAWWAPRPIWTCTQNVTRIGVRTLVTLHPEPTGYGLSVCQTNLHVVVSKREEKSSALADCVVSVLPTLSHFIQLWELILWVMKCSLCLVLF